MWNWHPGMLFSTSGDCPGSGMTPLTSNGPSLVKSGLMSSVARHSGDEVDPAVDPTTNTCARSACRTPPIPGLILVSSGVGGIVGTAGPSITGTTTGVTAGVGTGSGGGSFRDSQCPPPHPERFPKPARSPVSMPIRNPQGPYTLATPPHFQKPGSQVQHTQPPSNSSIAVIIDGITDTSHITFARSKSKLSPRPNGSVTTSTGDATAVGPSSSR